ncbi:MAG: cysteine desulfurase [Candidatus Pacebacteria bacterium]|nr:cysteine desulfurase [Candidatus Paceibacterota bacterium]
MVKSNLVYLDFAGSAEPNPSSIHASGVLARKSLDDTRMKVAEFIHARPNEIIFTASGTESNNLAISGLVWSNLSEFVPHVVTTNIEHPSVLETVRALTKRGMITSTIVPVEESGVVDPKKIKSAITDNTILVSVMYANNEIGTVQPIDEIAKTIRHYKKTSGRSNLYFHTDAVQAVNYVPINVEKLGVDLLTFSGAKVEGARGSGVLWKRKDVPLAPIMHGGEQEFGLRPGTENTGAITSLGKALQGISKTQGKEIKRLTTLRDYFFRELNKRKIFKECGVVVNGSLEYRLPNNINITFPKIPSELLVLELSERGVMVASKSACQSSRSEGSYVIAAIRPEILKDIGGLRFSLGKSTTKKEVEYTLKSLAEILLKLKEWYH